MKSGKQKREEIDARRREAREVGPRRRAEEEALGREMAIAEQVRNGEVVVDETALAPTNSYGAPDFVDRGTYRPFPFACKSCGKEEVWTPTQQKWWYEIAKGDRFTVATMCRPCRVKERRRKAEARRIQLEGVARKATGG